MSSKPTINILTYVLDDQKDLIEVIDSYFKMKGITNYHLFTRADEMLKQINDDVAICIIDYILVTTTGIEVIKEVKKRNPLCYFIVMSGELSIDLVVKCVNNGANKIILKGDPDFMELLISYLKEAINQVTERYDTYFKIWENFLETDRLFEQLKQTKKNESGKLDTTTNNI